VHPATFEEIPIDGRREACDVAVEADWRLGMCGVSLILFRISSKLTNELLDLLCTTASHSIDHTASLVVDHLQVEG